MADTAKIKIDTTINPFGETKTGKAPDWIQLRPGAGKATPSISVKRVMELDTRKWSKKDIEDGCYAVARFELARFATKLNDLEKPIQKALSAHKPYRGKVPRAPKDETPDLTAALDAAAKKLPALYKTSAKIIEDKLSLALEEIAADVGDDAGDNKKALAAGKEALKRFDGLDTSQMISRPLAGVTAALTKLETALTKADAERAKDAAFQEALRSLRGIETAFEKTGKTTARVIKYLRDAGDKIARDKAAAPELRTFGKTVADGALKKRLASVEDTIARFAADLDDAVNFAAAGRDGPEAVTRLSKALNKEHGRADTAIKDAVKEVAKLSKDFSKLSKAMR